MSLEKCNAVTCKFLFGKENEKKRNTTRVIRVKSETFRKADHALNCDHSCTQKKASKANLRGPRKKTWRIYNFFFGKKELNKIFYAQSFSCGFLEFSCYCRFHENEPRNVAIERVLYALIRAFCMRKYLDLSFNPFNLQNIFQLERFWGQKMICEWKFASMEMSKM